MGFVGLIIFGGLTLATNRPRGLAMIGGGIFGALLAGLAFTLVNTLTGQSVSTGMLLLPVHSLLSWSPVASSCRKKSTSNRSTTP
jgi:hypothetical protein